MRLSDFILSYREQILSEWVTFARSCLPVADRMNLGTLRDHASEMLEVIAGDLKTTQSKTEQAAKSEGKSDAGTDSHASDNAAQSHGSGRAEVGFDVEQMVSEYRALRASVIRLWVEKQGELASEDIEDLMRFNEAIDQALAESTASYSRHLNSSKEMFLAILGHDLRTPLGAVLASAHVMANTKASPEIIHKTAAIILTSGQRMDSLVNDMLDFTRSRLGRGIPVVRAEIDIEGVCRQAVAEVAAAYPQQVIAFEATGELRGTWDKARVSQALSNVISNARQHGSHTTPINVTARGEADEVVLEVQNWGAVIPADQLTRIFDPMYRLGGNPLHRTEDNIAVAPRTNLGLGLYIAERIVAAHGGTIGVVSSKEKGTTFSIRLPRRVLTEPESGVV